MDLKLFLFWSAILTSVGMVLTTHLYGNIEEIKENWSKYRCNPAYMLLAGYVDPDTGIHGNFSQCLNFMGKGVVGGMTDALGGQFALIGESLRAITSPLNIFRTMLGGIRKFVLGFATSTLGKASGPLSMFVYYLNKIQDIVRRIFGEGYIAALLGVTFVSFVRGFFSLIIAVIKGFVIAMLIISLILALFQPALLAIVLVIASSLAAAGG
jgi:hypothetical protein